MRKTASEKLKLGLFITVGLSLFVLAIYFIGENQNMFKKTFSISANFNNVGGLRLGNNVRYSGINIGTVKHITMVNDSTINVVMNIEDKMVKHIKKDAIATIGTDGLVGNMIVNIIPGKGGEPVVSTGNTIRSYTKIGTDDMLNTLSVTNENAALLTAKLLKVAEALSSDKGTLGMLINDTIVASNVIEMIHQLKNTSQEASKTMKELNTIVSKVNFDQSVAGSLLNDSIQGQKMKNILTNLDESSKDIKDVITNLNTTITNMKEGKGTLNYLSNDPELVKSIEETMKSINEGTAKFNENMEALKHNVLTRGYFRKQERLEKKANKKEDN